MIDFTVGPNLFGRLSKDLTDQQKQQVASFTNLKPGSSKYPDWMLKWLVALGKEAKGAEDNEEEVEDCLMVDLTLPPPLSRLMPLLLHNGKDLEGIESIRENDEKASGETLSIVRFDTNPGEFSERPWYRYQFRNPSKALEEWVRKLHGKYITAGKLYENGGKTVEDENLEFIANDINNFLEDLDLKSKPGVVVEPYDGKQASDVRFLFRCD